jgi:general secretion pathway protein G
MIRLLTAKTPSLSLIQKADSRSILARYGINCHGFTLIEVLVVIFILSILAALVAPKIIGRTDDARIAEAKLQIKNFETALKLFKLDNGFYPSTEQGLEALIEKPTIGRIPQNYREGGYLEQKKIPLDPWGNPYIYLCPGTHGEYDIISYGADGKEGGEGKDADITNWNIK